MAQIAARSGAFLLRITGVRATDKSGKATGPDEGGTPREEIAPEDFAGPDKSYPIVNHASVDDAASLIGKAADPEAVKAWIESMSFKPEYECILDSEPRVFPTREELEQHFVESHLAQFVTSAPEVRISGAASRQLPALHRLRERAAQQRERADPEAPRGPDRGGAVVRERADQR